MNIKKIIIALVIAALAVGAIFMVLPKNENKSVTAPADESSLAEDPSDGGSGEAAGAMPTYTMDQVAAHDSRDDCWTVINGSVYNITSYIPRHPGGDEILRACGRDATTLFTQRETEDGEKVGSGTPHSSSATAQLARLKIGELAD